MANGLPPLEKLKKKELTPLNSLKKKGDGTPQPETTSQPTGVITQPLAQGSQQGTQPQFTSWRDVAPPEVQEIQDVTATRKPISLQDKKVEGALKERAFNVISEEINNIEKADKAPDTFEYGKQFLKQRDGVDTQYQPKTKEQSLQEINRQVKDVYPNLQTTTINESGQTVYTDELQNGINALFVSKQNREAESNDKFLATVSRYKEMPSIFKPAMGVVLSVDALAYDIASLATQFVGADELTLYLRNKVEDWNQEKSALQASSGVTLEQQQKGAFATIKEDPIAGLKLLGYQTLDAIPSMAAIILAPEVSVGRTGAIQLSRGAAQQFVTPIASNVYKQALKDAYKTLGTRSNTGITALSGLESRSAYEDAISSGLSREEAIGIAMLKGISVYATEHVFMGAEDMVRNSLVNYGQDAAKNTVKKGMKDYLKEVGEQFSKEGLLEEGTVNLIGQIIDNAAQGKEFDIYSYLDESAVGGLMGAGSVSLKTVLDNTSSLVSTIMTNSELKQKGKVISELRKELENNIDLSQQDKESLKSALITAQKEYDDIRKEQDDLINKFSDEDKQSYIDINRNILSTIDKSRRTDNDVVKNVLNEKLKTLAQEKQAIEEKYTNQQVTNQQVTPEVVTEQQVEQQLTPEEVVERQKETDAKIKNKELFRDGGVFANELGGSGVDSVPTAHTEINGIEFIGFSNPKTGVLDVVMTGTSDNDFVGYYRIYENGKATNKWSSKFENQSRNKENFKTMLAGAQSMLPKNHQYTEKTSISTDGLRIWGQQLDRGYELQYDENGNLITNEVAINGDAIVNELGIEVSRGNFENIDVTTQEQFDKVKKALLPYLQKFGLNEKNIKWDKNKETVVIDLPVLKRQQATPTQQTQQAETQQTTAVATEIDNLENRRVTYLDPSTNEVVDGVLARDRKTLVVETDDGRIIEVRATMKNGELTSNIDQINESGLTAEQIGIKEQKPFVSANADGTFTYNRPTNSRIPEGTKLVDNKGGVKAIRRNSKGEIIGVELSFEDGTTAPMLKGQDAIDAAYQIQLRELQTQEQQNRVDNEIRQEIEQEYATNISGETTEATDKETTRDTKQTEVKDDTQAKQQVPSGKQEGKATEQAKPKQEASGEKAETGRDVQTPKEKGRVTPDKTKEEVRVEPDEKEVKEVAEKAGITPKNLKDLYKIGRDMFGLNKVQAFAQAVVMDRMIGAMAKRAGISKKEMYGKLEFRKGDKDTFKQLSARGKALFQIVGENAQLSQTIKDNLGVARDMEAAGKDAKDIRIATGWEKGKDGKWRYEIGDIDIIGDLKPFQEGFQGSGYVVSLGDFVTGEVLSAYPQLKDKITIVRGIPSSETITTVGAISKTRNGWDLYLSDNIFNGDLDYGKSVIIHEIQHAIQDIEGFARGSSPDVAFDDMEIFKAAARDRFGENSEKYKKIAKSLDENEEGISAREIYKRIAGEVEARNVQARMDMTPEQRRETLLQETEDVARDEQIVLFDEGQIPQGVKFQVDAWHGSPYQFDKFTTEKMGTGEGVQAFGWGLYFTDLESIARNYADNLTTQKIDFKFKNDIDDNFLDIFTRKIGYAFESDRMVFIEAKQYFDKTLKGKSDTIISESGKTLLTPTGKFKKFFPKIDDLGLKEFADYSLENNNNIEFERKRNLYKVSLHKGKTPDQYTWLEWDKKIPKEIETKLTNAINNSLEFTNSEKESLLPIGSFDSASGLYSRISDFIGQKEASLFLLENGIDGIKYPAESVSRGATSDTARGFNYVVFDENAISIEEVIKFQKDAEKARGAMMMAMDGKAIIYALTDPNVSTPLHELAHVFEHYLTEAERNSVLKWANSKEWTVDVSEKFARGFEKFLADGKAPTVSLQKIFNRFKEWLTDIYNGIVGSDIDIQLNDEMRDLYGKMLGVDAVKEQEKKSFANIIRGLKIDTTGKAFDATLGLPVAIYNNAIEITAKAVEAGVEVKKAIQKGIDYANKKMNGKKWDVEGFRNQLLTTIKGQFEQQAAQMRSSEKEVKTPKTRFLGFLTRSGAKIVNANDYIDSMKTNMNLDVSDTKKRIDDAKSKARKVFAKTNKIKNDKEVANIVNDLLNRIISPDEYNMTAQEAIDKIRKDIKNPKVAQELIDAGLDIRTQIDNMTKFMLENAEKFNLSDEAIENLKSNIGNYIHREYMFFSERGKTFRKQSLKTRRLEKWNPTDEMINEAIAEHAIYNGISVDEAKKQIEDLIEDWKKKRTPIKVTGNNVIRIQDVKVEADLMKGRVRIPQNFTLFSEASKEAEKELQKKGIDSENKNYNTLLSVETERIYKDKGGEYVELPPHLRKLLGEERNATQRYINTMLAMSNMVYKAQAMDMIVKSFDGKDGWIYDKEPANNKGDYKLVNDKYSPLNGKWVNIYLIEEFNKLPIYETDLAIAKAYFEYQSLVRTTKTAANPSTNFKNVIGGFFAQMQNGLFIALTNPKLAALSIYSRGHLYFKGRRNELAKQVLKDGAEAGVLSSSVDVEVLGLKGSILSERVKFGKSELGRRYAQQDDWTKSLMVYIQKQDVSLMLFGKKFDDLSKEQQKEVLTKTGELVKLGVPTFSKLPSWFRTISRLPTGDFISFTVEATRSLIGSGIIAYEHARAASTGVDSKGNTINETQRRAYAKDAAKRIAGLVAIQSVGKAIGAGAFSLGGSAIEYGSQVFAAIFGGGDDEDENDETKLAKTQVVKEINKTIPDWAVGDRVIVTNVDDDGNVTFYNWTGLEPSSETAQLIGGNFKYFEQFYKGSITAKMLIQLYNNENEIGNEIYLEDEPLYKQVFNSAYFLGKNTLLPPFINSTEYEIKRRKEDDKNFGVISQDNTVEENAQSAKELTQVFLSRATIRSYNYNIYNRVKQIAYAQSRHGRVDNLDNIKDEEQIDLRLKNISVIRDAYQICLKHRITTSDSPAKIKKISELNDAVKRNYTDFEEAMIYETDDAKFKEMYDFVMSKSKDIVEYNKLKDERKK